MSAPASAPAAAAIQALAEPAAAVPGLASLAGPVVVLLLLAAAALLLSRRRRAPSRQIQILETAALGPKRSLVLARLGGEVLLLGSTDSGITLLRAQPAGAGAEARPSGAGAEAPLAGALAETQLVSFRAADAEAAAVPARPGARLVDLATRLVPHRRRRGEPDPRNPAFEALLAESAEDQELRRKLSRGLAGSVR